MKNLKKIIAITFWAITSISYAKSNNTNSNPNNSSPLVGFTENKGQVHDGFFNPRPDVLYSGTDGKMFYYIKSNGISLQLHRLNTIKRVSESNNLLNTKPNLNSEQNNTVSIYRIDINWLGINKNALVINDDAFDGYENYYSEAAQNGATEVKTYKGITLKNIYNEIDLHYYSKNGELKYDYILNHAKDYKQIKYEIEGATDISIDKFGNLLIKTPFGTLSEAKPTVYQNGKTLKAEWKISGKIVSYEVSNYIPSDPLVIDPITRVWGTYYGGINSEAATNSFTDQLGFVYIYGSTYGSFGTVVATLGSHQSTFGGGGADDGYLAKFNSSGVRQWATYYGGARGETFQCGAADVSGNLYLSGITTSSAVGTAVATAGSHQSTFGGGAPSASDAFLVKFNNNGVRQWATFYGGTDNEFGYGCSVDPSGNVIICGSTGSSSAIATPGSHQPNFSGGFFLDGFVAKFNSAGVRQWGTYYGGNGVYDEMYSCKTDNSGNVYLVGRTATPTSTIIYTPGAQQTIYGGNSQDGLIVKFNSAGTRLWGTYYGGLGFDEARDLAVDNSNSFLYVVGTAASSSGTTIATVGSHQPAIGSGSINDAFLAKFDLNGVRQWGTYYGGTGADLGNGCVLDATGNFIYITGSAGTATGTAISSAGSYQTTYGGGTYDAFIAKFSSSGVRQWGTYYGGTATDYAWRPSINAAGDLYLAGDTQSNTGTIIATPASHQSIHGGSYDGFLVKFNDCSAAPNQPASIFGNSLVCSSGGSQTYSITSVSGANTYSWNLPAGWSGTSTSTAITVTPGVNSGIISVSAINACGSSPLQTLSVTVVNTPTLILNPVNATVCAGSSATLSVSGASGYTWNPGAFNGSNYIVTPSASTIYTITGNNSICVDTKTISVNVSTLNLTASTPSSNICFGTTTSLTANGANTYTWQPLNLTGATQTLQPSNTITYSVTGTNTFGCISTRTIQIIVNPNPTVTASASNASICSGNTTSLSAIGALTYTWLPGNTVSPNTTVSPSSSMIYTVTGSYANGCTNTKTISINVTITPTLNIVASNTFICVGNSVTIVGSGATSYSWNTGPTSNSISASPTLNTTYVLTGTNGINCTDTKSINIIVNTNTVNINVISSPTVICSGNNANIIASGALTYSWSTGSTNSNINVSPITSTTYTVTGYDISNCSNTKTISLLVNPSPTVTAVSNTSLLCVGQSATLSASGANNYTWSPGGVGTSIVISPTTTATYTVLGVAANGCQNTTSLTQSVSVCTGIISNNAATLSGVKVYPNPTSGTLYFQLNTVGENASIELYNAIGQLVLNERLLSKEAMLDLNDFKSGIYFIKVKNGNEIIIKKIIKE